MSPHAPSPSPSTPGVTRCVEVALADAGRAPGVLTYAVPSHLASAVTTGTCVSVPLGVRRATGVVLGATRAEPPGRLRAISAVIAEGVVPADLLELVRWAAGYYRTPSAALLRIVLPVSTRGGWRRRAVPLPAPSDAGGAWELSSPPATGTGRSPGRASLEARLLERLPEGGLLIDQLREEFGATVPAALRRLEQRGLVRLEDAPVERRAPAADLWVSPGPDAGADLGRARRSRETVEYVRARHPHPVGLAELEMRFPGARRTVAGLLRRGVLAAADPAAGVGRGEATIPGNDSDGTRSADAPEIADAGVEPNSEQSEAIAAIEAAHAAFSPFLLFGVTGSGKTEVYLRAAAATLARGRGVLLLVPEIGLTHQLVVEAEMRFPGRTAVLHSGLSESERGKAWRQVAAGARPVVIGARSALFAPLPRLGLIVVDEEHDPAYKQEESPRYHARDLAVMRAKLAACPVVLASATPSLESWQASVDGRYRLLELAQRTNRAEMPRVEIIDLRAERWGDGGTPPGAAPEESPRASGAMQPPLSRALEDAMLETYRAGEQTLLFLNRRGYSRFLQCEACGQVETCPDCSVSLTVHRGQHAALCHHCGYARPPAARCPACGELLAARSFGTEQIEARVRQLLPAARVARLDRDTSGAPAFVRATLAAWRAGELDVLIGTQMIAKGHDAHGVTLIGVVLADTALNFPDFRAAERAFQLLAQVSGRAGRGSRPGRVLVQTRQPEHPSLVAARRHDYRRFADDELRSRRELHYPPFGHLARIVLEGDLAAVDRRAEQIARQLREAVPETAAPGPAAVDVLGPAPAPIEKLRGRFRRQILIKARNRRALARLLAHCRLEAAIDASHEVRTLVDVDPISML